MSLISIGIESTNKNFTAPYNLVSLILLIVKSFEILPIHSAVF